MKTSAAEVAGREADSYAKAGDLRIAYQIVGDGNPIDLVWAPPMASHLVLDWEWPPSVEIRRGLARFCRLIRFDKRGTGLSDPIPTVATLEERTEDIRAVMDAAGSEQAVILGISEGGSMACLFAASPSAYAQLERMNAAVDVRDVLPSIRVPTLVMTRTDDPVAQPDAARSLASAIPNATFVEFPGTSHGIFALDAAVLAEIEEFVTGVRPEPSPDRVLRTMLFVDIVGSTERAVRLGDAGWKELLLAHYKAVRREIARFHGTEVDTAGDGFLATFDGPGRVVRCAQSILAALHELSIQVRAGIHAGEMRNANCSKGRLRASRST